MEGRCISDRATGDRVSFHETRAGAARLLIGAALLLLVVMAAGMAQAAGAFEPFDRALLLWTGAFRATPGGEWISQAAIGLGIASDVSARMAVMACVGLALAIAGKWRDALWLACLTVIAALVNGGLKHVFQAARPEIIPHLNEMGGFSFPSGHAAGNAAFLLGFAWLMRRRSIWGVALALIAAIGLSRIWLGVHRPTDVLCGWMEGYALFLIARYWRPDAPARGMRRL